MRRRLSLAAIVCVVTFDNLDPLQAQEPAFEFISIRKAPSTEGSVPGSRSIVRALPGGRFEAKNVSVEELVRVAYGFERMDPRRGLVETPRFFGEGSARYDLTAARNGEWSKPAPGEGVPSELRLMLQTVLRDRFGLKVRSETKRMDVLALRLTGGSPGASLRPSSGLCLGPFTDPPVNQPAPPRCPFVSQPVFQPLRVEAGSVTLADVARLLSSLGGLTDRPVVDQTGLEGLDDLTLVLADTRPTGGGAGVASGPGSVGGLEGSGVQIGRGGVGVVRGVSEAVLLGERRPLMIREALKAQLGLELQNAKLPVPTLVIERVNRPQED